MSDLGSHANAVAEAAAESGIKANIAPEMTMLMGEDFDFEADVQCCDFVKAVETWHNHDNGRILMEAGLHGEATSSHELWQKLEAANEKMDLLMEEWLELSEKYRKEN